MSMQPERSWAIWYCQQCRFAARCEPDDGRVNLLCRCATPVLPIQPCRVTETARPERRRGPRAAVSDETARLYGLSRPGARIRLTLEVEVHRSSWLPTDSQLSPGGGPWVYVRPVGDNYPELDLPLHADWVQVEEIDGPEDAQLGVDQ